MRHDNTRRNPDTECAAFLYIDWFLSFIAFPSLTTNKNILIEPERFLNYIKIESLQ